MNKFREFTIILLLTLCSCSTNVDEVKIEQWKEEIRKTEEEFAEMVSKEGISVAFLYYGADDAVLMRNNNLIIGKKAIDESFKNLKSESGIVSLSWKPDYIDVSSSGDMAYTYGKYEYKKTDSIGNTNVTNGVFHTVWKRQESGNWKFVWD